VPDAVGDIVAPMSTQGGAGAPADLVAPRGSGDDGQSYFAHATALIDAPTRIGAGTRIWHFCHVMTGARIGARCVLGQNCFVGARAALGDGCKVQNNVSLYDEVILEDEVFVGPSAVFTNVVNPRAAITRKDEYKKTPVGHGASIGANATIVCGHAIGPFAFVAAGAVVTRDVPPFALVAGVPARRVGWVCRCGVTLPGRAAPGTIRCDACGDAYTLSGRGKAQRLAPGARSSGRKRDGRRRRRR
jgi:UDP-2-acetamido-3-amino-2,3-dideoxy-glucuronate N-acetyltransferase